MYYTDEALDALFPGVSRSEALQSWYANLDPEWRANFDRCVRERMEETEQRALALAGGYAIFGCFLAKDRAE